MTRFLPATVIVALLTLCGSARAGQVWTDGNGDGLPDPQGGIGAPTPSTNVTVGVWVDAQSFNWTSFLVYVDYDISCITYVSAAHVISGGTNFFDMYNPRAIGFGGVGYNEGGVDEIGTITYHIDAPLPCCVTPIIDINNPYYTFSQLAAGDTYVLFSSNPGTCYGPATPNAVETRTWGKIKGLFR